MQLLNFATYKVQSIARKTQSFLLLSLLLLNTSSTPPLFSMTVSEKKAQLSRLKQGFEDNHDQELDLINSKIIEKQGYLSTLYAQVQNPFVNAPEQMLSPEQEDFLKQKINQISLTRKEILQLKEDWQKAATTNQDQDEYGLWQQPDTTISQLIQDYGSYDYVYVIPPEIGAIKIGVSSNLSIPRSSWQEMLDLILSHYGIGIRQLNPYMKQLFFLRINQSGIALITDQRNLIRAIPSDRRICFIITPKATEARRIFRFLEKFSPQEQMSVQLIGGDIVIVGYAREIEELMKIYDFLATKQSNQQFRLINLKRAKAEEVTKVILSLFEEEGASRGSSDGFADKGGLMLFGDQTPSFRVIPLQNPGQSIFLIGRQDQIEKAIEVIQEIEGCIGEETAMTIHWYSCKHSDPEELAKTLSQIYARLTQTKGAIKELGDDSQRPLFPSTIKIDERKEITEQNPYITVNSPLIVDPKPIEARDKKPKKSKDISENFIVDAKTGSIVMVVEKDLLPKLKELLRKLDVPKKMVQIDILLFEKRITDSSNMGLNLLRLGSAATKTHATGWAWNDIYPKGASEAITGNEGILKFSLSRKSPGPFPALDLTYSFLLSREDVHINANPSVTTINQTPAKVAIVDEIYVNTGLTYTEEAQKLKETYERNQYGITIQITPTIHAKTDDDEIADITQFITLETDIVFDTQVGTVNGRPEVTRRNIKNEVRVRDGETLILGGLRRKTTDDARDAVPFLGEIPGLGKFFSTSSLEDRTTEMFIFLTPKIVPDQEDQYRDLIRKDLNIRPGDVPELINQIVAARKEEKHRLFERGLKLLFDIPTASDLSQGAAKL